MVLLLVSLSTFWEAITAGDRSFQLYFSYFQMWRKAASTLRTSYCRWRILTRGHHCDAKPPGRELFKYQNNGIGNPEIRIIITFIRKIMSFMKVLVEINN